MGHDSMEIFFSKTARHSNRSSLREVLAMEVGAAFLETRPGHVEWKGWGNRGEGHLYVANANRSEERECFRGVNPRVPDYGPFFLSRRGCQGAQQGDMMKLKLEFVRNKARPHMTGIVRCFGDTTEGVGERKRSRGWVSMYGLTCVWKHRPGALRPEWVEEWGAITLRYDSPCGRG